MKVSTRSYRKNLLAVPHALYIQWSAKSKVEILSHQKWCIELQMRRLIGLRKSQQADSTETLRERNILWKNIKTGLAALQVNLNISGLITPTFRNPKLSNTQLQNILQQNNSTYTNQLVDRLINTYSETPAVQAMHLQKLVQGNVRKYIELEKLRELENDLVDEVNQDIAVYRQAIYFLYKFNKAENKEIGNTTPLGVTGIFYKDNKGYKIIKANKSFCQ